MARAPVFAASTVLGCCLLLGGCTQPATPTATVGATVAAAAPTATTAPPNTPTQAPVPTLAATANATTPSASIATTVAATPTRTAPTATKPAPPGATNTPLAVASPKPAVVSFSRDVQPIFQARCVSCHSGANAPAGQLLTSHAATLRAVKAGDPAGSTLYQYVQSDYMPFGGPPLSAAQKETIRQWIAAGALNN
ncbi:MAG: hypothetical protein ACYC4L_10520 [Chloroflexota bacterium]